MVVGAGAGLSASAGLTYSGERFERYFGDFQAGTASGTCTPAVSIPLRPWRSTGLVERQIMVNRYTKAPKPVYEDLLALVRDRDCFVLTTNVDHQFQLAGL